MFWFIVSLILFLVFFVALAVGIFGKAITVGYKDTRVRPFAFAGSAVALLLGAVVLFSTMITQVDTKNVGVVTEFGKPTGYIENGIHLVAPWANVTELNDAIQTDTYATDADSGKQQNGAVGTCVNVRIERQATACVNVSIVWQIRPAGVDYLFRNYKDNGAITDNLVLRNLQSALNTEFANYDPLGLDANGKNTNKPLAQYGTEVRTILSGLNAKSGKIGKYIDVRSVYVPFLAYDSSTQGKVNQLLQQIALTRVALQSVSTSQAQAKANGALQKSLTNNPGVLTDKCLNIVKTAVDEGKALPAGFNCFGNQTATSVPLK